MPKPEHRLLVVDDQAEICALIKRIASRLGFEVLELTEPAQFLETLQSFKPAVLIIDLQMPNCDGIELLRQMAQTGCDAGVLIMSGMDQRVLNTAESLGRSKGLKMLGIIQKPIAIDKLTSYLSEAVISMRLFSSEELDAAITSGEVVVHYQPKALLRSGAWVIDGTEALVRWDHPTHGLMMPSNFVPYAEDAGIIGRLTDHVLLHAIQQIAAWTAQGLDLGVAVNLSSQLIDDLEFPDRLGRLLDEFDVPGSRLTLELTETAAMSDVCRAMDILLRLRMREIELSIDDFGTGFSSLQKLYQLPFNELKIDRCFVGGLPDSEEARAVVRGTINLAHALNIVVCAEGVETAGALEYLERVECDRAQGFLISPAVPPSEIERVISEWSQPRPAQRASN